MPRAIIGSRAGSIAHSVGKPTVKSSTERPTICVAPAWTPAMRQHVAQPDAGPQRVAHELAADIVRDAGDGHVLVEQGHRLELVVGERQLLVHHAGDGDLPRRHVHAGHDERGIDAIELGRWA